MTTPRDADEILAAWVEEGPTRLPKATKRGIAVSLRTTRQRRHAPGVPWRSAQMILMSRAAAAVAVIAIATIGTAFILRPDDQAIGAAPSPSASAGTSPSASPPAPATIPPVGSAPTSIVDTTDWVNFTSPSYGYDISLPPDWTSTPAEYAWSLWKDADDWLTRGADRFLAGDGSIYVTAFAAQVPSAVSSEEWIDAYRGDVAAIEDCPVVEGERSITVDGRPGVRCGDTDAFVFTGGQVHVFTVWREEMRPLLDAFLSTVRFSTDAWVPFSSSRYGYEASYPAEWDVTRAAQDWKPWDAGAAGQTSAADRFLADDLLISAFAATLYDSTSDEWIDAWHEARVAEPCGPPAAAGLRRSVTVDGRAGVAIDNCSETEVFVFERGRLYVFVIWRPGMQETLDDFLSTVRFMG